MKVFPHIKHNQTKEMHLPEEDSTVPKDCDDSDAKGAGQELGPDQLGWGFFIVPDVEGENAPCFKKVVVRGLTYGNCVKRGQYVEAFQWVPNEVVEKLGKSNKCSGLCVDSCVTPGCICVNGRCM